MDKKVGATTYYKYIVTLPKEIVENSELVGKDLKVELEKNKIVLEKYH